MRIFTTALVGVAMLAAITVSVADEDTRRLTGSYNWTGGESGPLTAYFTPTDEADVWDVEFKFDFRGPRLYAGTAKGSLETGALSGEVESDGKRKRTFTFEGSFAEGTFSGTHAEIVDEKSYSTGTLTLQ